MDPITTAIVAALTAGAASGLTDVGKKAIADAYDGLKTLLKKKFGHESEVVKSVERLEVRPDSASRQGTLAEEMADAKVAQDADILHAAQTLLDQITIQPNGGQHIQNVIGNYNAVVQGSGNPTVNVKSPKEP